MCVIWEKIQKVDSQQHNSSINLKGMCQYVLRTKAVILVAISIAQESTVSCVF